jgi:hypothetical protein
LDDVRRALAKIPGSLTNDIRGERDQVKQWIISRLASADLGVLGKEDPCLAWHTGQEAYENRFKKNGRA